MTDASSSACFTFSDQEMPVKFGKYHLLARRSTDPVSEEFLAAWGVEDGVDQLRVLRCIYPKIAEEAQFVGLFSEEARSLSRLAGANIARIMEVGILGDVPFVCREHIEGLTLEQTLKEAESRTRLWPWEIATHVTAEVLRGLDYVHRREDLHGRPMSKRHGDIRPGNVILSFGGEVKLTNFGSTLNVIVDEKTNVELNILRDRYVPPEGRDENEPQVYEDLWGTALMFLKMLGGGLPPRRTEEEIRLWSPPAMSSRVESMPAKMDLFFGRALNPDLSHRFETASQMRSALLDIMNEYAIGHPPDDLSKWVTELGEKNQKEESRLVRKMLGKEAVMNLDESSNEDGSLGPGTILDNRYHLLKRIGEGGMGVVFEAEHMGLNRSVAVKVLHNSVIDDKNIVERFRREAQIIGRLGHPNIVGALDFGVSPEGYHYLAMDLLEGKPLSKIIEDRTVSARQIVEIIVQVCDGLQAAHEAGVIHRDLKPDNIFLTKSGARILDFGIAKSSGLDEEGSALTRTGNVCGTVEYMAPEQMRGLSRDPRSDLYALGVIIYEAMTGETPFRGRTVGETMHKSMNDKLVPLRKRSDDQTIPVALERVCNKALSKQVDKRFTSAADMALALRKLLPSADSVTKDVKQGAKFFTAKKAAIIGAMIVVALLFASAASWNLFKDKSYKVALKEKPQKTLVPSSKKAPQKSPVEILASPKVVEPKKDIVAEAQRPKVKIKTKGNFPTKDNTEARQRAAELITKGNALLRQMDFSGAKQVFEDAVNQDSQNSNGWFGLAKVAFQTGRYDIAIKNMNQSIRNGATFHKRNFLGKVYLAAGEREKAEEQWQLVLKTRPDDKTATRQLEKLKH